MSDIVTLNGYNIKDEKAVRSYESIASMKADTKLKEGYHVKTKGYYEANDGGHGEYVIVNDDTLVDDGGSIHVLTNGLRAKLLISDYVTPEMFGAKGDNETDDSTSINNLLAFTNNIYLNDKTYLITSSINLNDNSKIIGNKDSIIHKTTNNSIIIATDKNNITLKDFSIIGDLSNTENQNGIALYNCSNSIIDNINISDVSNDGIYINNGNNINVTNMNIYDFKHIGYLSYQGNNTTFKDSIIDGSSANFKYTCQFKSCINSLMDNITIKNGTEISLYISQEDIADNPDSIRPINNKINNITCINHGKNWTVPSSGIFGAIVVDGDNSTFNNINIVDSYTGGFYSNANNSNFNNINVLNFAQTGNYNGINFRSGNNNNISNITAKKGNGYAGFRSSQNYSNIINVNLEDTGSTSNTQMIINDKDTYYNNITLFANTIDCRGIQFYISSTTAENVTVNNLNVFKTSGYTSYDISGTVPSSINIIALKPTKNNIRGNATRPFTYINDKLTLYEIDSANSYANLSWLTGDTRVFSRTGIAATGYEKTIYNGSSWVNVNSLS